MTILHPSQVPVFEAIIRDKAGEVINACHVRKDHPSYGYTKGLIRSKGDELAGMIGVYMVMSGQSANTNVATLARFTSDSTTDRVEVARKLLAELDPKS